MRKRVVLVVLGMLLLVVSGCRPKHIQIVEVGDLSDTVDPFEPFILQKTILPPIDIPENLQGELTGTLAYGSAGRLYLLDLATGTEAEYRGLSVMGEPSFSPNGQSIVLDASGHIFLLNVASGEVRRISPPLSEIMGNRYNDNRSGWWPAFSPDGEHVIYSKPYYGAEMYVIKLTTNELYRIQFDEEFGFDASNKPAWSPDGTTIVFTGSSGEDYPANLFTIEAYCWETGTCQPVRVTDVREPQGAAFPAWSSDNTRLIYRFSPGGYAKEINSIDINSREVQTLVAWDDMLLHYPIWSPDGRYLAFMADDDYLYVGTADGQNIQVLSLRGGGKMDWHPDQLIFPEAEELG